MNKLPLLDLSRPEATDGQYVPNANRRGREVSTSSLLIVR